jgi:hypothetical protein
MKQSIFCLALFASVSITQADAKENSSQLAPQKALPFPHI